MFIGDFPCIKDSVYIDDGYTGRNFERPGFQKMVEQCRMGKIGSIVVKDLSRLGRNYVEVGNLLEQVFPFLGIRVFL
ncbi:MAG: recombinase family protein [Lachnospiraceae bacterium]|nr:recombinase family protein [Lachnospiraceae bacterium]